MGFARVGCLAKSPRFCIRQSQVPINLFAVPPNRHLHRPNWKKEKKGGKERVGKKELVSDGDSFFRKKAVFPIVEHEFGKFSKYRK